MGKRFSKEKPKSGQLEEDFLQIDSQGISGELAMEEAGFSRDKKYRNLPLVVIAGRPNVGKSTLFNRLLHRRRAITDPTPGVTRDPIQETAFINGYPVNLMDTGGFKLDRDIGSMEAVMDELVVEQTIRSLEKADVILLLLVKTVGIQSVVSTIKAGDAGSQADLDSNAHFLSALGCALFVGQIGGVLATADDAQLGGNALCLELLDLCLQLCVQSFGNFFTQ